MSPGLEETRTAPQGGGLMSPGLEESRAPLQPESSIDGAYGYATGGLIIEIGPMPAPSVCDFVSSGWQKQSFKK